MTKRLIALGTAALLASSGVASAADYDESLDGDLLDLTSGGTLFDVGVGTNSVFGTVGGSGIDFEDLVVFTIDAGELLTGVTLTEFVTAGGNTSTGFRLYTDQGGGLFQASGGLITTGDVGTNYLNVWNLDDFGGSAPLGPGTYGVLLAEFTEGQRYSFDIEVIPAPGAAGLAALAGLAAIRRRR